MRSSRCSRSRRAALQSLATCCGAVSRPCHSSTAALHPAETRASRAKRGLMQANESARETCLSPFLRQRRPQPSRPKETCCGAVSRPCHPSTAGLQPAVLSQSPCATTAPEDFQPTFPTYRWLPASIFPECQRVRPAREAPQPSLAIPTVRIPDTLLPAPLFCLSGPLQ